MIILKKEFINEETNNVEQDVIVVVVVCGSEQLHKIRHDTRHDIRQQLLFILLVHVVLFNKKNIIKNEYKH